MNHNNIETAILNATGANTTQRGQVIQSLWSGYGEIVRYHLSGAAVSSVVVKHVVFPSVVNHPRGWNNDVSHQRKVTSYEVEMAWYHDWAKLCDLQCRVPQCYQSQTIGDEHIIILEDLDSAGFSLRKSQLNINETKQCLFWLANFHATFLGFKPQGLWSVGTYWFLATRPDEFAAIADKRLRQAAPVLDDLLNNCNYQTLVHGDAKVANFCFANDGVAVAAVDFQYVGGGCGMKDVAYLLGSCLSDREQQTHEQALLNYYFECLVLALKKQGSEVDTVAVEHEWRGLFKIAQADFYRFLVGWMPTHWKINDYSKAVTQAVVQMIDVKTNF